MAFNLLNNLVAASRPGRDRFYGIRAFRVHLLQTTIRNPLQQLQQQDSSITFLSYLILFCLIFFFMFPFNSFLVPIYILWMRRLIPDAPVEPLWRLVDYRFHLSTFKCSAAVQASPSYQKSTLCPKGRKETSTFRNWQKVVTTPFNSHWIPEECWHAISEH